MDGNAPICRPADLPTVNFKKFGRFADRERADLPTSNFCYYCVIKILVCRSCHRCLTCALFVGHVYEEIKETYLSKFHLIICLNKNQLRIN